MPMHLSFQAVAGVVLLFSFGSVFDRSHGQTDAGVSDGS